MKHNIHKEENISKEIKKDLQFIFHDACHKQIPPHIRFGVRPHFSDMLVNFTLLIDNKQNEILRELYLHMEELKTHNKSKL
jgi:hypothetical protein